MLHTLHTDSIIHYFAIEKEKEKQREKEKNEYCPFIVGDLVTIPNNPECFWKISELFFFEKDKDQEKSKYVYANLQSLETKEKDKYMFIIFKKTNGRRYVDLWNQ